MEDEVDQWNFSIEKGKPAATERPQARTCLSSRNYFRTGVKCSLIDGFFFHGGPGLGEQCGDIAGFGGAIKFHKVGNHNP